MPPEIVAEYDHLTAMLKSRPADLSDDEEERMERRAYALERQYPYTREQYEAVTRPLYDAYELRHGIRPMLLE